MTLPHRFSERTEHWFTAESHGLSIASESFCSWPNDFSQSVDYQALLFCPQGVESDQQNLLTRRPHAQVFQHN